MTMTMKATWFRRFGGPEVLVCEETRKPTPEAGEAVVRVRAAGINHVDLDIRAGTSRIPVTFPHILGREFAGEVVAPPQLNWRLGEGDARDREAQGTREYGYQQRNSTFHVHPPFSDFRLADGDVHLPLHLGKMSRRECEHATMRRR